MIQIREVRTPKDWEQFIDLPWKIYKNDPTWVPPLRIAVKDQLDVNKNPFFKHAFMNAFLAFKDGELVGRIVGSVDENHNRFHKEQTAFFGFFEATQDPAVAKALFEAVEKWSKSRGMSNLRGPVNLSTNFECGLLVEGFQDPPAVMMTYNPEYYGSLIEGQGFTKIKDLLAYNVDQSSRFSERLLAQSERLKANSSVRFRPVDMRKFDQEVDRINEIYNDAWEQNWGFVPMNLEEFRHMAKDMKAIVDPNLLLIAEVRGEPVGFGLALPDVHQAFKKIPDGKLLPTGLLKLLWNTKGPGRKKTINRCRILTLGIKQAYRNFSLGPLFLYRVSQAWPSSWLSSG